MGIEDKIFNQLVQLDIFNYEEADTPHECRCCGAETNPTYKLKFDEEGDKDLDNEAPYLYICSECYKDALQIPRWRTKKKDGGYE